MKNDNFGFKIDIMKWKKAIEAVNKAREGRNEEFMKGIDNHCEKWSGKNGMPTLYRQGFSDYMDFRYAEELTKLYSIRAHSRGRIHRKHVSLNYYEWRVLNGENWNADKYNEFLTANDCIKFNLTIEDQANYIGDSWQEYVKVVVE